MAGGEQETPPVLRLTGKTVALSVAALFLRLPVRESAVQSDVSAGVRCFPSAGLRETETKARPQLEAALVHRR